MIFQQGVDSLAKQHSLDPLSRAFQRAVVGIYRAVGRSGQQTVDALYGTWLGHPLHPALTDVTIGAWAASVTFDLLSTLSGSRTLARCANASLALGTAAAVPTAAAGLADFQHPIGEARRVGAIHGIVNLSTIALQAVSLVLRARGKTGSGRLLSAVTFGSLVASAYLGGELINRFRVGTNHAAQEPVPEGFAPVIRLAELRENEPRQVNAGGADVVLVRQGDEVFAMHSTCTHLGGPLAQGTVVDSTIQCPWHGSRFALEDGHVVRGPASFPERCLETRVRNGMVEVGPGRGLGRCAHEPEREHERAPMQQVEQAPVPPSWR